jgi:hypothetical protein
MQNRSRPCKNSDWRRCANSEKRYFARIGVFKYGFGDFACNYYSALKSNLFENKTSGSNHRVQMECNGEILVAHINNRYHIEPKYDTEKDKENSPCIFDCWRMLLIDQQRFFTIEFLWRSSSYFSTHKYRIQWHNVTFNTHRSLAYHIYDSVMLRYPVRTGASSICMALPWFDRIDRMIFQNFLMKFDLHRLEFHSLERLGFRTSCVVSLFIFVHQYL